MKHVRNYCRPGGPRASNVCNVNVKFLRGAAAVNLSSSASLRCLRWNNDIKRWGGVLFSSPRRLFGVLKTMCPPSNCTHFSQSTKLHFNINRYRHIKFTFPPAFDARRKNKHSRSHFSPRNIPGGSCPPPPIPASVTKTRYFCNVGMYGVLLIHANNTLVIKIRQKCCYINEVDVSPHTTTSANYCNICILPNGKFNVSVVQNIGKTIKCRADQCW